MASCLRTFSVRPLYLTNIQVEFLRPQQAGSAHVDLVAVGGSIYRSDVVATSHCLQQHRQQQLVHSSTTNLPRSQYQHFVVLCAGNRKMHRRIGGRIIDRPMRRCAQYSNTMLRKKSSAQTSIIASCNPTRNKSPSFPSLCFLAEIWERSSRSNSRINKLCGRPPQYAHAPCDLDL